MQECLLNMANLMVTKVHKQKTKALPMHFRITMNYLKDPEVYADYANTPTM